MGIPHEPIGQEILPHFTVSWDSAQATARAEPMNTAPFSSASGLTILFRNYRPEPFYQDTPAHFICIVGHPIVNERIDKAGAVQGYLRASDKTRFASTLNGEFLIIHLDKVSRVLTIVNDRFAAVPFYYAQSADRFVGSVYYNDVWNEVRHYPNFKMNHEAFFEFMHLQRLLGTKTYDNCSRFLPAASILVNDGQKFLLTKYWEPNFTKDGPKSLVECSQELISRLKTSIRRKTSDGARYGLFLSGGMDTRTILAAFDPPPVCFTVGFSENNEARIAKEAARIRGAPHRLILLPQDYYSRWMDSLVYLGGGMYVFDHALFFGLRSCVVPHADVVFHGHGMDYLFQGMYVPMTQYRFLKHQTYLRRVRPLQEDLVTDYLSNVKFRLKHIDLFRYVRPAFRSRLQESLRDAVQQILEEGRHFCETPYDFWEYLLIHALSRHYSNCNISDLITSAEQRTLTFENDLFSLYLALPVRMRFAAKAMRGALRMMSPQLARLEAANTGVKIDSSPLEQEFYHTLRYLKRLITGNPEYRHPTADDRTWPYRDGTFRLQPELTEAAREASRSEVLSACLPFLDMDVLSRDVEQWLNQSAGGGDLIATLVTIDRFLKQP